MRCEERMKGEHSEIVERNILNWVKDSKERWERYPKVPDSIKSGIDRYCCRLPFDGSIGSFLREVLENDLMGAMDKAHSQEPFFDPEILNGYVIVDICRYIKNEWPAGVFRGSPYHVRKWLEKPQLFPFDDID